MAKISFRQWKRDEKTISLWRIFFLFEFVETKFKFFIIFLDALDLEDSAPDVSQKIQKYLGGFLILNDL